VPPNLFFTGTVPYLACSCSVFFCWRSSAVAGWPGHLRVTSWQIATGTDSEDRFADLQIPIADFALPVDGEVRGRRAAQNC